VFNCLEQFSNFLVKFELNRCQDSAAKSKVWSQAHSTEFGIILLSALICFERPLFFWNRALVELLSLIIEPMNILVLHKCTITIRWHYYYLGFFSDSYLISLVWDSYLSSALFLWIQHAQNVSCVRYWFEKKNVRSHGGYRTNRYQILKIMSTDIRSYNNHANSVRTPKWLYELGRSYQLLLHNNHGTISSSWYNFCSGIYVSRLEVLLWNRNLNIGCIFRQYKFCGRSV
jgi:hypothetical protein